MLRSLFGRKKKPSGIEIKDDSIRSAGVGDVIHIVGWWETGEDAYLIVQQTNKLKSPFGESNEVVCEDGGRRALIEWTDSGGLSIFMTQQAKPMGLSSIGMDEPTLAEWDQYKSIENRIEFDGSVYYYHRSHESRFFENGRGEGDDLWVWEFVREDDGGAITVLKYEGLPFEVYESVAVDPRIVTVYHK